MVNPYSAGTLTLQEAPSFAWRTNDPGDNPRRAREPLQRDSSCNGGGFIALLGRSRVTQKRFSTPPVCRPCWYKQSTFTFESTDNQPIRTRSGWTEEHARIFQIDCLRYERWHLLTTTRQGSVKNKYDK